MTILGFLFLFITTIRRKDYFIIDFEKWIRNKFFSKNLLIAKDGGLLFVFITFTCVVIVLFILLSNLFWADWARDKAVTVILFSLGFYYIIFTGIEFLSKYKNVPFLFIGIFIFMIINVSNNAHHDVRTIEPAGSLYSQTSKRASFDDYFKDWVKHRAADIKADSTGVYPVYIVAAEGGGSRAGFWTSYVLSKLQDETDGKLSNHIFGMTGASGGQVGMTMFNTTLKADYERGLNVKSYCEVPEKVYQEDFISTSLLFFLGRDFWQSFNIFYESVFS